MTASLTDILCTQCGLCCDGTLLADVELAGRDEVAMLEVLGLEVEDADGDHNGLLLLPCGALKGTRCSIYEHRPGCCRTFECRLLQETTRGVVEVHRAQATIADARRRIAHIQSLLVTLGQDDLRLSLKERCADALAMAEESDGGSEAQRTRDELEANMESLDSVIRQSFL